MNFSDHWELIAGGAALAVGLWGQVRSFIRWLGSLVVVSSWLEMEAAQIVTSYLVAHGKRVSREPVYYAQNAYLKKVKRSRPIIVEWLHRTSAAFWYKRAFVWTTRPDKPFIAGHTEIKISTIRWMLNIEQLMIDAMNWQLMFKGTNTDSNLRRHTIIYHYGQGAGEAIRRDNNNTSSDKNEVWSKSNGRRLLGMTAEDIGSMHSGGMAMLALPANIVEVTEEIRRWFSLREWYSDRLIPWRRNYLYDGGPGTGKTSHIRAIGEDLDLPIHVLDLASMCNEDLRTAWNKIVANAPCIALAEDIDGVFNGRTNIAKQGGLLQSGGLSFDTLLNCIDGVERCDGVLSFVTTNHAEKLDPALTRPGRIDRKVTFGPLEYKQRLQVAKKILRDDVLAERTAAQAEDMPASRFVEVCARLALNEQFVSEEPYR